MIIAISGKMQVGKTTMAEVAVEHYGFTRLGFADALKQECFEVLQPSFPTLELSAFYSNKQLLLDATLSNLPELFQVESFRRMCTLHPTTHQPVISLRAIMQWYGQYRRELDTDYWVQKLVDQLSDYPNIVVDDMRHINEAVYLQILGATLIRINRPLAIHTATPAHLSETALDNFPGFHTTINKPATYPLEEFINNCHDHLRLLLGDYDETTQPATKATAVFTRK